MTQTLWTLTICANKEFALIVASKGTLQQNALNQEKRESFLEESWTQKN